MWPEMASEEELASRRQVGNMNTGNDRLGRLLRWMSLQLFAILDIFISDNFGLLQISIESSELKKSRLAIRPSQVQEYVAS